MNKRYEWIDAWRGLAIIGMVVFHWFLMLDFFGIADRQMYEGWWLVLARSVQFSFLLLVGVSMVLLLRRVKTGEEFRARQLGRALVIGACALLVTIATWIVLPDYYVRFGILHLITFSILILIPLANKPAAALALATLAIAARMFTRDISTSSPIIHTFGFAPDFAYSSIDFFPVLPWVAVPALGLMLGHALLESGWSRRIEQSTEATEISATVRELLAWCGKRSLIIYMVHAPALLLLSLLLY